MGAVAAADRDWSRHLSHLIQRKLAEESLIEPVAFCRDAPCGVIAVESEFGDFVHDGEILQAVLTGELIPETDAVIKDAEDNGHSTARSRLFLLKIDTHLIIVVTDLRLLAPYGVPVLVVCIALHRLYGESFG